MEPVVWSEAARRKLRVDHPAYGKKAIVPIPEQRLFRVTAECECCGKVFRYRTDVVTHCYDNTGVFFGMCPTCQGRYA
jgi:hypothetical protein